MSERSRKPAAKSKAASSSSAAASTRGQKGQSPRAGRERGRSRDHEVLETAVRIFWEKGYAGASMQDVADALGLLKGSLYYYVDSKESLLMRIFEDNHNEILAMTKAAAESDGPAVERMAAYLREYALWTLTHVERAGLFAREWRYAAEPVRSALLERTRYYNKVLRDLILAAQDEGDISENVDPQRTMVFIWGAFTSLPDWYRPDRGSPSSIADEYVAMALRTAGVKSSARSARRTKA